MDDFWKILPSDEEIKEREKRMTDLFNKYSNCKDDHSNGLDIDELIECFEGDNDEEDAEFEEAIESDDCDELEKEGAIGFGKRDRELDDGSEDGDSRIENKRKNNYKRLEVNYGPEYIKKAKKAYLKKYEEMGEKNLKYWNCGENFLDCAETKSNFKIERASSADDIETVINKLRNAGFNAKKVSDQEDSDDVIDDEEVFKNAFKKHYAKNNI